MRSKAPTLITATALAVATAGWGGVGSASGDSVSLRYALWDANQLPAYEECAEAFEDANPTISISIEQQGWDDYWTGMTTGFIAGTAPDVFTNHLAFYPEFAETEQIVALDEWIERDGIDTDIYFEGLVDLWQRPDGRQYGLPKDWDTIALVVNDGMLADAGIDAADLAELTWNPDDGGSFEELIAALSIDEDGVRGNEDGFDAANVAVFGFGFVGAGGGNGQTEWSWLAVTNGFQFTNEPVWGTEFFYDDDSFVDTIDWIKDVIEKGYAPPFEVFSTTNHNDLFKAQQTATTSLGSWEIGDIVVAEFDTTYFSTPVGPSGERASMFNGLADSITAGTSHPDESWEWVKFLASADCQSIVAEHAVVFPAIPEAAERVAEVRAADGVDVSAFTVHVEEGTTFTFPIADWAADRDAIMGPAMEAVFTGSDTAETLQQATEQINNLF